MADFGSNFINALTAGHQARAFSDEREARQYVEPAMRGDSASLAKLTSLDPKMSVAVTTALQRMDANQRAKVKEQADYSATSANAILQADQAERPALYQQLYAEGQRRGYDMSGMPPQYSPALDGRLRSARMLAVPITEWFKQNEGMPTPMGGGGGAPPPPGGAPQGGYYGTLAAGESGGNYTIPNAQGSGAYGKYQFMPQTWATVAQANPQLNLPADLRQATPDQQEAAVRALTGMNATALQKANLPVNASTLALAHWVGADGARAILQASPETPLSTLLSPQALALNPGLRTTAGALVQQLGQRYQGVTSPAMEGTQPVTQGDASPAQPPTPNAPQGLTQGLKLPQGARMMGIKGVPVVKDGNVLIIHPDGRQDWLPLPKQNQDAWEDVRNPAGQIVGQRNKVTNEFKPVAETGEKPPAGYRSVPGGGQEFIPGGPADPAVIKAQSEVRRAANEKAIPQSTVKGMQDNLDALKQIDRATAALNAYEKGVGGTGEYLQQLSPGFGGDINNKIDPKGTQVRALIADIGSLKIHDRSGAAVTAAETPRLIPFIPKITDSPQVIRDKLANFKAVYSQMLEDFMGYYNAENGFKEYKPARDYLEGRAAPAQPATPDKGPPKDTPAASPPDTGRSTLSLPRLSPEDAAKLEPGTPFIGLDGIPRTRK